MYIEPQQRLCLYSEVVYKTGDTGSNLRANTVKWLFIEVRHFTFIFS